MIPIHTTQRDFNMSVRRTLSDMPRALVDIILDYSSSSDYEAMRFTNIRFDRRGRLVNQEVRNLYKEALMSSYCSPDIKSQIMRAEYSGPYLSRDRLVHEEMRLIFLEITQAGYQVMFDHVDLSNLVIESVDWTRISLRNANLSGTRLINVNMPHADMSSLTVDRGEWTNVSAQYANLTDTDLTRLAIVQATDLSGAVGQVHPIPRFVSCPVFVPSPPVTAGIAALLDDLPPRALELITGYMENTNYLSLDRYVIYFDSNGNVTTPEVRQAYKEAFMSSYCKSRVKSELINNLFAPPSTRSATERELLAQEGRTIFNEIVAEGYHAELDDIALYDLTLRSINWAGASLIEARMRNVTMIGVDLRRANARRMWITNGAMNQVNFQQADLTGVVLKGVRFDGRVSLEGTTGDPEIG